MPDCLEGFHWDYDLRECVPNDCPQGYHWDGTQCVPDVITPTPSSDLLSFPEGAKVDIYVGRGNAALMEIDGKKLHLLGLNITTVRGLLIN